MFVCEGLTLHYLNSVSRALHRGVKKASSILARHRSLELAVFRHSNDSRHRDRSWSGICKNTSLTDTDVNNQHGERRFSGGTLLTDGDMNIFHSGLQMFLQRSHLLPLNVALAQSRGVTGQLGVGAGVFRAAVGRRPVQLSQKLLEIFKRVLPVDRRLGVRLLPLLIRVSVEVPRRRGGQAGAEARSADAPPLGLCRSRERVSLITCM